MKICISEYKDIHAIAKVHQLAFPLHLSSALGISFVRKTLSWYLENPQNGFITHVEEDGKILGYVTGFYNDGKLKHGSATTIGQFAFKTALVSFMIRPWLLFHPEIRHKWKLILKQFTLKVGSSQIAGNTVIKINQNKTIASRGICGLLSIGVNPVSQGRGVGSLLIQAFERTAFEKFNVCHLELSVKSDNLRAKKAYLRNGWIIRGEQNNNCLMKKTIGYDF